MPDKTVMALSFKSKHEHISGNSRLQTNLLFIFRQLIQIDALQGMIFPVL